MEQAPPKQVPRTLENTREEDETMVAADDEEARPFSNRLRLATRPVCSVLVNNSASTSDGDTRLYEMQQLLLQGAAYTTCG